MIIFTGGSYIKAKYDDLDKPFVDKVSQQLIIIGYRWIKSKKKWSGNPLVHGVAADYQILTDDEAKAQGLM